PSSSARLPPHSAPRRNSIRLPVSWDSPDVSRDFPHQRFGFGHRARIAKPSAQPPADLGGKALVEFGVIDTFRRLAHPLVEAVGIVADQNAPAFGLDALENDPRRLG